MLMTARWLVSKNGVQLANTQPYCVTDGQNLIADVYGSDGVTSQDRAHLIAAAPETAAECDRLRAVNAELVAALGKWMRAMEWEQVAFNDPEFAVIAETMTRAAIAKAEQS